MLAKITNNDAFATRNPLIYQYKNLVSILLVINRPLATKRPAVNDSTQHSLTDRAFWMRALFMLFYLFAYSVAEVVLTLVVLFQFVVVLFTGRANEAALKLGNNLAAYVYQIMRYLTYNTEAQPFPFSDWPDDQAEGERWRGGPAGTDAASAATEPTEASTPASNDVAGTEQADKDSAEPVDRRGDETVDRG